MTNNDPIINEYVAAQKTLLATTRRVGDALPKFSTWLIGGSGAALALVVVNIENVSRFIEVTHIRFGLIVFLLSLALAVLGTYISTMVKAAIGAQEDDEAIGKEVGNTENFNLLLYMAEYERGLFPPIRWLARSSMRKAMKGDIVAGARMMAKLSQVQALLVVSQSILVFLALGALVFGMKMQ